MPFACVFSPKSPNLAPQNQQAPPPTRLSMKKLCTLLGLLMALLPFASAQNSNSHFSARQPGWVTFGLDAGLAYQSADVRTQFNGWGFGATLGKNLYYRPGAALSFDLRGRALLTRTYGADFKRAYGLQKNEALNGSSDPALNYLIDRSSPNDSSFVYSNYRHTMGELGLEGVFTFNRLRERTGIVFSLFGGIGLDVYRTRTNQLDDSDNTYNYLPINANGSRRDVLADLSALRDNTYESYADGFTDNSLRLGLMPGAGFELGYQVAPRFVIGIGHKITFSRTDVLDGQRWTNSNNATSGNDWQHYTNLHLRWDLQRRKREARPPEIEFTDPRNSPHTTSMNIYPVRAVIRNVDNPANVRCFVNGNNQPFDFRSGNFNTDVRLRPGRNDVRIVASNRAGRADETTIIVLEERVVPPPPPPPPATRRPEVRITSPARSPYTTSSENTEIIAVVRNVREARNIRLLVNGVNERFSFADDLMANVRLRPGRNIVRVEAVNADGEASDEVEIIRQEQEPQGRAPEIRITRPERASENTPQREYDFEANVLNVSSRNEIALTLNGNNVSSFDFDTRSGRVSSRLQLRNGENRVVLRAQNRYGNDEASATLNLSGISAPRRPEVDIIEPLDGASVSQPDITLRAGTRNVSARSEISVSLNGQPVSNFEFDTRNQTIRAGLRLREGENTLSIRVTNNNGADDDAAKVRYYEAPPPMPKPPVIMITAPLDNSETSSSTVALSANVSNVSNKADVTLTLNGRAQSFEFNGRNGATSAQLYLAEGTNTIRMTARNSDGSDETSVTVRYKAPAAVPPVVRINAPANNSETGSPTGRLDANVSNVSNKSEVTVTLNGRSVPFEFFGRNGQVTADLTFAEGANTIRVSGRNSGGSDEASVAVRYKAPVATPPQVTITAPANNSETGSATTRLTATVTNVTNKADVTVTNNGRSIPFEFNGRAGQVSADVTLNEGPNTMRVSARNSGGSDEASVNVRRSAARPPVITITAPRNQETISQAEATLTATVTNVSDKGQIVVLQNGRALRDFTFERTGKLSAAVTLITGKNTLTVQASNADGRDEKTVEVTFRPAAPPPVAKPEVAFTSPAQSGQKTSSQLYTAKATVKNVSDRNGVKVKVNGTEPRGFQYDVKTGIVTVTFKPNAGKNTISVEASNAAGTATANTDITYSARPVGPAGPPAPTVKIESASQPTVNPMNPNEGRTQVIARTENVANKSEITVKVNGTNFTDFTFDAASKRVDFVARLKKGNNTVEISVKNATGEARDSTTVKFE